MSRLSASIKITAAAAVALALCAFWLLGYDDLLTLDELKRRRSGLRAHAQSSPLESALLFSAVYVTATALSVPGAALLTLLGGAVFGFANGTIIVSFASTFGATISMLFSRYVLAEWVRARFSETIMRIDRGLEKEGALYLLTLRLVPIFPFVGVNLCMGVTRMGVLPYWILSQIGMLPATAAYVYAGTELGRLDSAADILSLRLLLALTAIGLLPIVALLGLSMRRRRKALQGFARPQSFEYDAIVVGGGAAGLIAARTAAKLRGKVALIESERQGGECLYTGCVPSKTLLRCAHEARASGAPPGSQFEPAMEAVREAIRRIEPRDSVERYSGFGIECVKARARVVSPFEVEAGGRRLSARSIVLATGSAPAIPPIPGLSEVRYRTNETIWELERLPERLVVVGGGPVGVEISQAFARLGSRVTLVQRAEYLLPREEPEASEAAKTILERDGVEVLTGHRPEAVMANESGSALRCRGHDEIVRLPFDEILIAAGRRPRTAGFGLEELGVELDEDGAPTRDEYLRTSIPTIFVCGDVAGPYRFTHAASYQAAHAALNGLLAPIRIRCDESVTPWCIFCSPEIARVGLREADAAARGIQLEVSYTALSELDRAVTDREELGFVKLLSAGNSGKILGATIVAPRAGEMIHEIALAMKHGIGMGKIAATNHVYPTYSEGIRAAASGWRERHTSALALAFLEKLLRWRRG